jgi:hypothetical protein
MGVLGQSLLKGRVREDHRDRQRQDYRKKPRPVVKMHSKVRKSEIAWLYPSDDLDWCYRRMTDIIMDLNEQVLSVRSSLVRQRAFSSPSTPHPAVSTADTSIQHPALLFANCLSRFNSLSLKITRAVTLCLYLGDKAEVMKKEQGFVALFPSYVLHEVKPVTSGTRYSLVSWITGKPFK